MGIDVADEIITHLLRRKNYLLLKSIIHTEVLCRGKCELDFVVCIMLFWYIYSIVM
jgi:hypothetical protein